MVVVSANWVKNVATVPPIDVMVINSDKKMTARAALICRPNSHPFQDRTLNLDQAVKVGRSVARARATPTNAIFDCKVLSRHHALLWYEDGKFFLQDTKSSNGTFVNNNRLSAETEHHEVSSGDIVQFGVDVVENNRKVTHGCIVATLKLYLPDGKEAKASATIVENSKHGVVPLDELYKLHQIIQEAAQREQCLETKLIALQSSVNEARKSADDSWQVYVGEEKLLSRIAALETQLQQTGKNWNEDKCREELHTLQEDIAAYQVAAKDALEKLHTERLDAIAMATEQERSRVTAELEVLLLKDQLAQAQHELKEVAQKLTEEQKKSNDERLHLEQQQRDLQIRLDVEVEKASDLQNKLEGNTLSLFDQLEKHNMYNDDLKMKEEILAENDCQTELNNGVEQNHINLTVVPVVVDDDDDDDDNDNDNEDIDTEKSIINKNDLDNSHNNKCDVHEQTLLHENTIIDDKECERHVTFNLPENDTSAENRSDIQSCCESNNKDENEKDDFDSDNVDSKTLKYKYQSAQNELKKKIELLESIINSNKIRMNELEKLLNNERQANNIKLTENDVLKEDLVVLQQKWKENCNEGQQLKDKVNALNRELENVQQLLENNTNNTSRTIMDQNNVVNNLSTISNNSILSYEQLVNLEEEIVLLKERYGEVTVENLKLKHDLLNLQEKYNFACNRSHNIYFIYLIPLILAVLYYIISAMIS